MKKNPTASAPVLKARPRVLKVMRMRKIRRRKLWLNLLRSRGAIRNRRMLPSAPEVKSAYPFRGKEA